MSEGDAGAGDAFSVGLDALRAYGTLLAAFELGSTVRWRARVTRVMDIAVPFAGGR